MLCYVMLAGATVSLHCPYNLPAFRFLVVQLPRTDDRMSLCEVEVFAISKQISPILILNFDTFLNCAACAVKRGRITYGL